MIKWRSLFTQFGAEKARSLQAAAELTRAYQAVFRSKEASETQREIVLADLAMKSGFYRTSFGCSSEELWRREGARALFGEIFSHLSLAPEDMSALENAARKEAALDEERTRQGLRT